MRSRILQILPWLILVAIIVATLSPIQFRPRTDEPPQLERFVAYALLGLTFAIAFPRVWFVALVGLPVIAYLLEIGQRLTPDRHWGLPDLEAKIGGAVAGVVLGLAIVLVVSMLRSRRARLST